MDLLKELIEVVTKPEFYTGILAGLGALKLIAKVTKTTVDDKVVDFLIKMITYPVNVFKK